jgi:hypothetical protein
MAPLLPTVSENTGDRSRGGRVMLDMGVCLGRRQASKQESQNISKSSLNPLSLNFSELEKKILSNNS